MATLLSLLFPLDSFILQNRALTHLIFLCYYYIILLLCYILRYLTVLAYQPTQRLFSTDLEYLLPAYTFLPGLEVGIVVKIDVNEADWG